MKKFIMLGLAIVASIAIVACSKEDVPETKPDFRVQLHLTGEINQATRVNTSGFENDDKVGVYVSTSGTLNTSGNTLNNEAFTYTDGKLVAPEGKEVYWGSENVRLSVWAYYPYIENVEDNTIIPFVVSEDQSTADNYYNSDFITASKINLPPQETPVELAFDHLLSKISIALIAGEDTTIEELAAAEKSFYINGVVVDGTVNLSDASVTSGSTIATVSPLMSDDGLGYSAIVYPKSSNISFRMEIGEDVYIYSTDVEFESGYQYKYTLKVNVRDPQETTLESATINNWQDGELAEGEMSDIITFADPKFKEYLLQEDLGIYEEDNFHYTCIGRIDANNDGEISIAEAKKVERIDAVDWGISDLRELPYFPNLKLLRCAENSDGLLTSLDLSNNKKLINICVDGKLTTLDVSNNTALETLICTGTQLTVLDVSNNVALKTLHCSGNQLSDLNISNNLELESLLCNDNKLTTIDVSNNTALTQFWCTDNQLTDLDVSNNIALQELMCDRNLLTTLDVSSNVALEALICSSNKLTSLDVSNNLLLTKLVCDPMIVDGQNILETIYMAEGQEENFETLEIPEETEIEVKE